MLKYLVVAIVIVPVLLGFAAATHRDIEAGRRILRFRWLLFSIFWVALLHFLRYWWR